MKTWTLLILTLLLGFAPAASAGTQTTQCSDPSLNAIFASDSQAPVSFLQATEQPTCEVLCTTSPCQSHDQCTAAPNGRCDFVCPQNGCCVYPE